MTRFPNHFPELRGNGILLRQMTRVDVPAWYARLNDPEARALAGDPEPVSIDQVHDWLDTHHASFEEKRGLRWAIVIKTARESVGSIGLVGIDLETRTAEIGAAIARPHWRQGIATRAAELVMDYAFNDIGLKTVSADVLSTNVGSIRVLEKLGFDRVNTISDYRDTSGLTGYLYENHG